MNLHRGQKGFCEILKSLRLWGGGVDAGKVDIGASPCRLEKLGVGAQCRLA